MQTIQLSKKQSYGSINNRLSESCSAFPLDYEIKVGLGGTDYMWSDRKPYTVCVVHNNWKNKGYEIIGVQADDYKRIDTNGMSEDQDYEFTTNIENTVHYLKSEKVQTKNGIMKIYQPVRWNNKTNRWNKGGTAVTLGHRKAYYDFSF
jgi:hypothetical protein